MNIAYLKDGRSFKVGGNSRNAIRDSAYGREMCRRFKRGSEDSGFLKSIENPSVEIKTLLSKAKAPDVLATDFRSIVPEACLATVTNLYPVENPAFDLDIN